jgi:hypothetical protein
VGSSKQGETPSGTLKRPRLGSGTPAGMIRTPERPTDLKGPRTYTEALTNIKIAIFKETYPEEKLTEDDQDSILEILGGVA